MHDLTEFKLQIHVAGTRTLFFCHQALLFTVLQTEKIYPALVHFYAFRAGSCTLEQIRSFTLIQKGKASAKQYLKLS